MIRLAQKFLPLVASVALAACAGTPKTPQWVWVYKYDGSVQCEDGGVPVAAMQRELDRAGVDVVCGRNTGDGKVYPAMCGAATGRINAYLIARSDLAEAETLGFTPLEVLPEARMPACD